ncbi:MAG: hypothetical protein LAO56_26070 [Acidobacteriia bacterium]|nr:hypothetical protein [Terriglobia bacterium]
MRALFLSFSHPSQILFVGLLVLSTHLLWAQRTSPLTKISIHLLDTPAAFARVSEVQTRVHLTYSRLPLTFEQNQGQTELRMRFFPHYPSYYRLPINTNAALYPATKTAELWGKQKQIIVSAPSKWLKFAPTYGKVPHETTYRVENLEHYGHLIPWAGSIILRIGQQAKAHPHVTRVLTVLKPRL